MLFPRGHRRRAGPPVRERPPPHPLQGDGRLVDGIERERELLRDLRGEADLVIDTTGLNVHELRAQIAAAFGGDESSALRATVVSFGYKYGLPVDADLVVDCRFLPNPHWVPRLRPLTGQDPRFATTCCAAGCDQSSSTGTPSCSTTDRPATAPRASAIATVAVGCTGGKHRSVAIAERLSRRLTGLGIDVAVIHRDLGANECPTVRHGPDVVALGGGHGSPPRLAALRQVTDQLTAIVTVADDGGSSGRLRDEFGVLPPGDLRMALAALAGDDDDGRLWSRVLQHRFPAPASWPATLSATC